MVFNVAILCCILLISWVGFQIFNPEDQKTELLYTSTNLEDEGEPPPPNRNISRKPQKESTNVAKLRKKGNVQSPSDKSRLLKIKLWEIDEYLQQGNINAIKDVVTLLHSICKQKNYQKIYLFQKLAECSLYVAERLEQLNSKKEIIECGIYACDKGLELHNANANIHKWYAGLLSLKTWMAPYPEARREYGLAFLHHLDIAFALNSHDPRLYFMLGHCLYQLIGLPRHSTSNADNITYNDALLCFREAHRFSAKFPRDEKEVIMYLGKCYLHLNKTSKGMQWLQEARQIGLSSHPDISHLNKEIDVLMTGERSRKKRQVILQSLDPQMVELVKSDILITDPPIQWEDIAGLEDIKHEMKEAVVYSITRPDLFKDHCEKGILLYGPPGTGKTLIGKCVASQSKSTFFNISVSSLTSKWVGDGEKMIRAMFTVARCHQPAVIFIDEIDALLCKRNSNEHESSRRMKAEFLIEMDGLTTDTKERLLIIGATNRPQDIDSAAMRRFKDLYIPLPERMARHKLVTEQMSKTGHKLTKENLDEICNKSDGYSGADLKKVCSHASRLRIRSIIDDDVSNTMQFAELRPVTIDDFQRAFEKVKPSISSKDLEQYINWSNNRS